ncbi:hypothetical protein Tco_1325003 [Tanacetum coccineum]
MVARCQRELANCVDMVLEKDFAGFALQEMKIHPLMLLIQTLSMILQTFSPTLHNPSTNHTRVNYVGTMLIMVMIVHHGYRLSMSMNRATIIIIHKIHRVFHNNILIVKNVGVLMKIINVNRGIKTTLSRNLANDTNSYRFLNDLAVSHRSITSSRNEYPRYEGSEAAGKFNGMKLLLQEKLHKALQAICEKLSQQEQTATVSTHTPEPSRHFFYDDDEDEEESTIPLNEHLSTIPEKESDEFIKSSVKDLVLILSESKDISDNDSECDLPFCDNLVTFSNPLFDSNDDFTSSDDNNVNPLFDEVLEDIESKDSYVSNFDEPALLVTPLSDANEDECFDPGGKFDEIEACLTSDSIPPGIDGANFDPEGDILLLEKLLNDDISFPLPPKELHFERFNIPPDFEEFLDHDPKNLKDELDNKELKSMVKVFDPGIWEIIFFQHM